MGVNVLKDQLWNKEEPLKVKLLNPRASLPSKQSTNAAGLDLTTAGERRLVHTGIAIQLPRGTYGRVAPRSGLAVNIGQSWYPSWCWGN